MSSFFLSSKVPSEFGAFLSSRLNIRDLRGAKNLASNRSRTVRRTKSLSARRSARSCAIRSSGVKAVRRVIARSVRSSNSSAESSDNACDSSLKRLRSFNGGGSLRGVNRCDGGVEHVDADEAGIGVENADDCDTDEVERIGVDDDADELDELLLERDTIGVDELDELLLERVLNFPIPLDSAGGETIAEAPASCCCRSSCCRTIWHRDAMNCGGRFSMIRN